ncbi:glycoside hydrolase family 5 protein [Exidia glandulosa HHB12029]|uniref:Glycoside hydrolase family 5 protein n=1 Tax=Exidia glandulosa HHB12029 TaxID=1314781 RepID=A0A165B746_EXIGL|nr:glycoside hydrolase family 5 protein [Exidia glandulosa HHB12029]
MRAHHVLLALVSVVSVSAQSLPVKKIYGVNIGNWLVMEPWMMKNEWVAMGGEHCDTACSTCIGSEMALAQSLGTSVDAVFQQHWNTWFNQTDINKIKAAGLNTVRIPLGYWLVEPLVNRTSEFYAKGGLKILKTRLKALKAAGINVILDHHALPGAAAINQMFAGLCTPTPQFYTTANYERALVWAAVMTAFIHLDADFASVFSLQAINEPVQDARQTPVLGQYEVDFVKTVRSIEQSIGVFVSGQKLPSGVASSLTVSNTILAIANSPKANISTSVRNALKKAQPMLVTLIYANGARVTKVGSTRKPLFTNFMEYYWQNSGQANPADAASGPQTYDQHLYYNFGGVAKAHTETAYMTHLCNLDRVAKDTAVRNTPVYFGEFSLATGWNATDSFLNIWADAQKLMYSQSSGWIFWSFKIEDGQDEKRQWDYFETLKRGYMTQNPASYHNSSVCATYKGKTT